jgi:SpoVK/Ycf46/Vps4 family AAA+-type ATPase
MSIIMGAIGGLGEGMQATGKLYGEQALEDQRSQNQLQNQTQLAQLTSNLTLQREQALEQFKADLQNSQRTAMATRIGDAQTGIVNNAIGKKYAQSDAAVAAADAGQTDAPLTDEQRTVIDQSKQSDRDAMMSDPDTYTAAAMKTGDLDPKTVATVNQRDQAAQYRLQAMQDRMQTLMAMNTQTNETRQEIAQLREAMRGNGKIDTATGRMMITSLDTDMKANMSQRKTLADQLAISKSADKKAIQDKIDEIDEDNKRIRQQKQAFFDSMDIGGKKPATGTAAPDAGAAADDGNAPVGVRQNNPGNIKDLKSDPSGKTFMKYDTPQQGFDALQNQLLRYARGQTTGQPLDTVQDIISTWAPASDKNDTPGYIKEVAEKLGVAPDAKLNLTKDPSMLLNLATAIAQREVGPQYASRFTNTKGTMTASAGLTSLPTGAVQIGTSGGKPVYQTPDGKRFIQG